MRAIFGVVKQCFTGVCEEVLLASSEETFVAEARRGVGCLFVLESIPALFAKRISCSLSGPRLARAKDLTMFIAYDVPADPDDEFVERVLCVVGGVGAGFTGSFGVEVVVDAFEDVELVLGQGVEHV